MGQIYTSQSQSGSLARDVKFIVGVERHAVIRTLKTVSILSEVVQWLNSKRPRKIYWGCFCPVLTMMLLKVRFLQ